MQGVFADLPDTDDHVHPCRPTISCTADIVAPGRLEVEAGGLYASAAARTLSFPVLLKLSLTPLVQLQVGSNGYTLVNGVDGAAAAHYLDNVFLGPKLHLHDQGDLWPSLALSAQVSVPTFSADGYTPNDDVFATAFASKDFAFVHVDWNVGALLWRVNDSPVTQAFTALALSPSLPAPFGATIEGYYFSNAPPLTPRDGGIRAVANVTARSWMVFDVGGDVGFFPSTRAYSLFLGVTLIPVTLWRTAETESR
jgi:hypothetical protein